MEENNYEQYEWLNFFYEGYDVASFNNNIDSSNGNNDLLNYPISLKVEFKNKIIMSEQLKNKYNKNNNNYNNNLKKRNESYNYLPKNSGNISFGININNSFYSKESPLENSLRISQSSFLNKSNTENKLNNNKKFFVISGNKNSIKKQRKIIQITPRVFVIIKEKEK